MVVPLHIFNNENQDYNEENFKPKQRFYYSKLTWYKQQTNRLPVFRYARTITY
jgi:hypothetical protein